MQKALVPIIVLFLCVSFVAAQEVRYDSGNAYKQYINQRFINPDNWEPKNILEDESIKRNQQLNVVIIGHPTPRQVHRVPELYWGSRNVPNPVQRRGVFDRALDPRMPFYQQNDYITDYASRVKDESQRRQFRMVPVDRSIAEQLWPKKPTPVTPQPTTTESASTSS